MKIAKLATALLITASLLSGCDMLHQKRVEQVREELKKVTANQQDLEEIEPMLKQMGGSFSMTTNYPVTTVTLKFGTINVTDFPADYVQEAKQVMLDDLCASLDDIKAHFSQSDMKALSEVLQQDNYTMKFVIKDKVGRVIVEGEQVFANCPNFASLAQAK